MIKFFRHIRKKLVVENKFTKYLIYAIGEIVLVVIGILIALQINNNNELKKSKAYELKMLNEIKQELEQDTAYFSMIKVRAQSLSDGAQGLTQFYDNSEPPLDSLKKYSRKLKGFKFIYRKGAYEALKETGLDKVSNDSLRILLTNLYDFVLPRTFKLIETPQSEMNNWSDYFMVLHDLVLHTDTNGIKSFQYIPKKNLKENERAALVLDRYEYIGSNGANRITSALTITNKVLELLTKELKKHD